VFRGRRVGLDKRGRVPELNSECNEVLLDAIVQRSLERTTVGVGQLDKAASRLAELAHRWLALIFLRQRPTSGRTR
jgi:hypothetical protein